MNVRTWSLALACAVPLLGSAPATAAELTPDGSKRGQELANFSTLKAPAQDAARAQALDWLKAAGKTDEASQKAFEAIWNQAERPLLDKLTATFSLGDPEAVKLLDKARNPDSPALTEVPALLKDDKKPAFYRANLGLAVAKALSNRRVHEEALEVLKLFKPEQVADPAGYFFHRAVAEHALMLKDDASRSILAVMEDVAEVPARYKDVSVLMLYDMKSWKEKDLGKIARLMDTSERRLELARGGPKTQKVQKEIISRLDELIKEMENQAKGSSQCNAGGCPGGQQQGGQAGTNNPNSPMKDSNIANNGGPGNVDQKRLKNLMENWGKLPEKDRAKAMAELTRDLPPRHREVIEKYFKDLARTQARLP